MPRRTFLRGRSAAVEKAVISFASASESRTSPPAATSAAACAGRLGGLGPAVLTTTAARLGGDARPTTCLCLCRVRRLIGVGTGVALTRGSCFGENLRFGAFSRVVSSSSARWPPPLLHGSEPSAPLRRPRPGVFGRGRGLGRPQFRWHRLFGSWTSAPRPGLRRRLALEGDVLLHQFGKSAHCEAPATRRPRRASGRWSSERG